MPEKEESGTLDGHSSKDKIDRVQQDREEGGGHMCSLHCDHPHSALQKQRVNFSETRKMPFVNGSLKKIILASELCTWSNMG